MAVVKNEINPKLEISVGILREARNLVRKFEKGQQEAADIFITVTQKNMEEVQDLMHRVSEEVRIRALEVELIHKNGNIYWSEVKAKFIKESGKPLKIIGVTREITE